MPIFYRGAGVGTYWHNHDARVSGFTAKATVTASLSLLMHHIAKASVTSPYISLTRSWGVAEDYARLGRILATQATPGYVYELSIDDPLPSGLRLIDPIQEVAASLPGPLHNSSYHHDGYQDFLLGVVDPIGHGHLVNAFYPQPPPGGGTPRSPILTQELETLVRALRDAEILALGTIPGALVVNRHSIW